MYRSLCLIVVSLCLVLGSSVPRAAAQEAVSPQTAAAEPAAEPPKVSITASNLADAELFLTLSPGPALAFPRPPARPAAPTNQVRAVTAREAIAPHHAAQFELAPGRYVLNAMTHLPVVQQPRPVAGLISVTNSETWMFTVQQQPPVSPSVRAKAQLVLEIPSRPGFRFVSFADRPAPRTQRTNFPPVQIVGTNVHRPLPNRELKLPATNQ